MIAETALGFIIFSDNGWYGDLKLSTLYERLPLSDDRAKNAYLSRQALNVAVLLTSL